MVNICGALGGLPEAIKKLGGQTPRQNEFYASLCFKPFFRALDETYRIFLIPKMKAPSILYLTASEQFGQVYPFFRSFFSKNAIFPKNRDFFEIFLRFFSRKGRKMTLKLRLP